MDFRKKLKTRLAVAIVYMVLGLTMIVVFNVINTDNSFLSSFGLALVVIGLVRLRNYFLITKSEESIKKQQIAESDERNIAIAHKAKSITFMICTMLFCVVVIVLQLLEKSQLAMIVSGMVCVMLVIYWITYWVVRKRS